MEAEMAKRKSAKRVTEVRTRYRTSRVARKAQPRVTRTEHPHIVRAEGVCGGDPVIEGTRITVWVVADAHKFGKAIDEMLDDWPHVNRAQLYDALSYYYDHKEETDKRIQENSLENVREWVMKNVSPELQSRYEFERVERKPLAERFPDHPEVIRRKLLEQKVGVQLSAISGQSPAC